MAFLRAQRLMLRVEAAGTRFAIDATHVIEVASAPAGNAPLHGHLVLEDLSARLGGEAEPRPEHAIVLDTSPTLALRVAAAPGVTDAAGARTLMAPPALSRLLEPAVRGVLELHGGLHFELAVDALAKERLPVRRAQLADLRGSIAAPQSLVFANAGMRFSVPLHLVRQIVNTRSLLPSPLPGPLIGAVEHAGRLWPVWCPNEGPGPQAARSPLAVLVETQAGAAALCAESAEGVRQGAALQGVIAVDVAALFA